MKVSRVTAMLALCLTTIACEKAPTEENDDMLPVFTAFWKNTADPQHTFVFQSDDDGLASGTFTGTENHPVLGDSTVEGAFQNSIVTTFVIRRAAGDRVYTGKFLHADTLRIFRTGESMLLAR